MTISETVSRLPNSSDLQRICKSVALLDAVLQPEWDLRYFSFNTRWRHNKALASMKTAEGDEYYLVFCSYGTILIGHTPHSPLARLLRHSPASRARLNACVPDVFRDEMNEPVFETGEASVFLWNTAMAPGWGYARLPEIIKEDYSEDLLFILNGDPVTYVMWVAEYFEVDLDVEIVRAIYKHTPLTSSIIARINADAEYSRVVKEAEDIGYPVA